MLFFYSAGWNDLCNLGRGNFGNTSMCDFLNFGRWFQKRCRLNIFLFFSFGNNFEKRCKPICKILLEDNANDNSLKLF